MDPRDVPLFSFGFHSHPAWLKDIAEVAKKEPLGGT